jgi:hypothetical protein
MHQGLSLLLLDEFFTLLKVYLFCNDSFFSLFGHVFPLDLLELPQGLRAIVAADACVISDTLLTLLV